MLDQYQRRAVDERRNAVVTAGAGSGKTTVLAERFINLIASGEARVEGILTLTFTRKAAAEMYERIYRLLLQRAESAEEPQVRRRLKAAVEGFEEASISTLDSFCSQVLRGGSERFGVPGDFQLEQGASGDPAREAALEFMLRENKDPALERYVGLLGFSRVLDGLFAPYAARELHLTAAPVDTGAAARLYEWLNRECREETRELEALRERICEAEPESPWAAGVLERVQGLPDTEQLVLDEKWQELSEGLEAARLRTNGRVKKAHLVELNELVIRWNESQERLAQVLAVPAFEEAYHGLYRLLEQFRQSYLQRKRESGLLSFRDVMEAAVTLLIEDHELRNYYKRQFSHIMIDEFQDNNDLQRRLLYLLSESQDSCAEGRVPESGELEPEKLFFVGDEKQSIYRFRGADVEVFQRLKREFSGDTTAGDITIGEKYAEAKAAGDKSAGGSSHRQTPAQAGSLLINYRSHGGLVSFFNTLFSRVMDPGDEDEDFEARYSPVQWIRQEAEIEPRITLFYKPYRKEQEPGFVDANRAEAWHVCRSIRNMVEEGLPVHDGSGGSRPCTFDDIAVLMRSTGNQIHYERFLRRLGVPYTVQGTRSLFLEAPAYDIYHLLQLLLYPDDRLAYASLLRSPLINLSDLTLARLTREGAYAFQHSGDEDLFPDEEERRKYVRGREMYRTLAARARRASIGELLRTVWYDYGYRYAVLHNPDHHPYLEFYDTLQAYARLYQGRGDGLVAFVDFLRQNLGQFEKVEETGSATGRARGVQILSVHRSKGLEFPVVFLVDTGNTGRQGGSSELYTNTADFGPVLTWGRDGSILQNHFMRRAKEEEERRDLAELKRLFYVACTRAEDHLFVSGFHHSHNRSGAEGGAEEGNPKAMLNLLLQAAGWNGAKEELTAESVKETLAGVMNVEEIPDVTEEQIIGHSRFTRPIEPARAADAYVAAAAVERSFVRRDYTAVECVAPQEKDQAGKEQEKGDDGQELPAFACDPLLRSEEEIREFGTLVHARIQEALAPGFAPSLMPAVLAEKPQEERRQIESEAGRLASLFLTTELGRAAKDGNCECELPFLLRMSREDQGDAYVRGQIDLLIEEADRVTVCDFKTDRRRNPGHHAGQLAVYRRAAEELYGKTARTLLCYLRSMELAELPVSGEPGLPPDS